MVENIYKIKNPETVKKKVSGTSLSLIRKFLESDFVFMRLTCVTLGGEGGGNITGVSFGMCVWSGLESKMHGQIV